jgi:hypothetical protein
MGSQYFNIGGKMREQEIMERLTEIAFDKRQLEREEIMLKKELAESQ